MARWQPGHSITLLSGGEAFFSSLLQALSQAQREIRLETYIFNWDRTGLLLAQALEAAALRGVRVWLTVDGLGTPEWPEPWVQRFAQAGVAMQVYAPLRWFSHVYPGHWHRLHRKLVVVDRVLAYCGGHNIMDDYWDHKLGDLAKPRLDFSVAVQGPMVLDIHEAMCRLWWSGQVWHYVHARQFEAAWRGLRARWQPSWRTAGARAAGAGRGDQAADRPAARPDAPVLPSRHSDHADMAPADTTSGLPGKGLWATLLLRDSLQHRAGIERAYLRALAAAKQDVLLANAYFIPGFRLRQALRRACERGVRVTLLLQGRYESFMQFHASRAVYASLMAAGVEIVTYSASQLHGKVAVIDGRWATVGSSNLDPLSLLMAREANVAVQDPGFARQLRQILEQAMAEGGERLQPDRFERRAWYSRAADLLALGLMRVLLVLAGQRYR